MALSTLFQVLLRALVSIYRIQLKWRPSLDDAIAMYFPADPASLHSFPPCLLYQQRGILFIVRVKKYRLLFIRFITSIFGRGIGTVMVRVYRCGPLVLTVTFCHIEKKACCHSIGSQTPQDFLIFSRHCKCKYKYKQMNQVFGHAIFLTVKYLKIK